MLSACCLVYAIIGLTLTSVHEHLRGARIPNLWVIYWLMLWPVFLVIVSVFVLSELIDPQDETGGEE